DIPILRQLLGLRRKLIRVRHHDQLVQPLHVVTMGDEFRRQIIQQLRIRRFSSKQSEITWDALQALAEMPSPDAIHGYAREQRIAGRAQPLDKSFAPPV